MQIRISRFKKILYYIIVKYPLACPKIRLRKIQEMISIADQHRIVSQRHDNISIPPKCKMTVIQRLRELVLREMYR